MKPKVYRKTKANKGSDLAKYKNNNAGGKVKGIIVGPETSTGTTSGAYCESPHTEQGDKKLERI